MTTVHSIPVRPPFPWTTILQYLTWRCTPGLDTVEADRYCRKTAAGGVAVNYDAQAHELRCIVDGGEVKDSLARVQRLFDTAHDPAAVSRAFRGCPVLGPLVRRLPGVRAPGCWEPFELCLRVILGQQVSVKAAHTLMGRLSHRCPGLQPDVVASADLSALGLTGRRLQTLRTFAERVAGGSIRFEIAWADTAASLLETPGIGPWTVQYLAIRLGRDADAFPESDLGLLRATKSGNSKELLKLAESWRPYRGYAAMYLWAPGAHPASGPE